MMIILLMAIQLKIRRLIYILMRYAHWRNKYFMLCIYNTTGYKK